ncbi:redoxin family protein [Gemella bergeri ATCC 700627]|uniref:Redoxin family protein n=1 Tax=Gemella bergeri ATCC 700627 TaxID=1321820 RepID=U2Q0X7_9BACL|nr:TlpA disulfide reductase family protein [Gemella bergeri]ERK56410.1 redoxin family protein [Gemella bergeri ATCC 700627]
MKKKILLTLLMCGSVILAGCSADSPKNNDSDNKNSSNSQTTKKTESQAFDFSAMDKDGNTVKLSNFKGKKVYINTWASWCGPCIKETPELINTYNKFKDKTDFAFLSMTSPNDSLFKNDNPGDKDKATILAKAKELGINYPILFDVNDRFFINYSIRSFPTHIFINSNGTINKKITGMISKEVLEKEINALV